MQKCHSGDDGTCSAAILDVVLVILTAFACKFCAVFD